jgi:hypothetical protein
MTVRDIKPKQIRVTDKKTGERFYFRGFRKNDAENAVLNGRFESEFLTADEFFEGLQAGEIKNVVDLTIAPAPTAAAPAIAAEEEDKTPAE